MIDTGGRRHRRPGGAKLWVGFAAVCAVSALLGEASYYGYRFYCETANEGFLKGTTAEGEDIYGLTVEEAAEQVMRKYDDSKIVITEGSETDLEGNAAYYGYRIDEDRLRETLQTAYDTMKGDRMSVLRSIFDKFACEIEAKPELDEAAFEEAVQVKNLKVARYPSKNAELAYDEKQDQLVIAPEIEGNEISESLLRDFVKECVEETIFGGEGLDRSFEFPKELCEKPQIYRDNKELIAKRDAINEFAGAGLTYVFGEEKVSYDLLALSELMDIEDGKAELSDEKIESFVEELASEYNTRYEERTFESTLAGEITIPAGRNDYGYTILQEDEAEQIREDIESGSHVEREPLYLETNSWGNPYYLRRNGHDDLAGTYIEVDLTAQHVWYYKDGELYIETDCVSGDVTKDRGTHVGCYPLAYKESPSVLTGGQGDSEYEEEVNYWMPFYEGQGLHDATWRYYFGGSIYRGNGSHGCVNLPLYAAEEIYNAVETGTAIIIFYE